MPQRSGGTWTSSPTRREWLEPEPAERVRRMANVPGDDEVELLLRNTQFTDSHLARVVGDDGTAAGRGGRFLEHVIKELVGEVSNSSHLHSGWRRCAGGGTRHPARLNRS